MQLCKAKTVETINLTVEKGKDFKSSIDQHHYEVYLGKDEVKECSRIVILTNLNGTVEYQTCLYNSDALNPPKEGQLVLVDFSDKTMIDNELWSSYTTIFTVNSIIPINEDIAIEYI